MSTRCQIGVYEKKEDDLLDWKVLIYKHHDGYPEEVLPLIINFAQYFDERRGMEDWEYFAARLVQCLTNYSDAGRDNPGVLSYGVCRNFHGDLDYYYKVYPYAVEAYKAGYSSDSSSWKKIKTVKIKH